MKHLVRNSENVRIYMLKSVLIKGIKEDLNKQEDILNSQISRVGCQEGKKNWSGNWIEWNKKCLKREGVTMERWPHIGNWKNE